MGYSYIPVKPQLFRIGDIVEAQITLAVIRGKKRTHRMKPILRAIVMLDKGYTQVHAKPRILHSILMVTHVHVPCDKAAVRAKAMSGGNQATGEGQGQQVFK